MESKDKRFVAETHQKFVEFKELEKQYGSDLAWEKMLEGLPEKQKKRMAPFLGEPTLFEGFTKAIPFFESAGMEMEVVDLSNKGSDAVLEIQKYCPYLQICKEYNLETPCHVICDIEIEGTRRAFPEMKGEILARQAFGSCVCLFKYERPVK